MLNMNLTSQNTKVQVWYFQFNERNSEPHQTNTSSAYTHHITHTAQKTKYELARNSQECVTYCTATALQARIRNDWASFCVRIRRRHDHAAHESYHRKAKRCEYFRKQWRVHGYLPCPWHGDLRVPRRGNTIRCRKGTERAWDKTDC